MSRDVDIIGSARSAYPFTPRYVSMLSESGLRDMDPQREAIVDAWIASNKARRGWRGV